MARMGTEGARLVYFTHLQASCERVKRQLPAVFRTFASPSAKPSSRRNAFRTLFEHVNRARSRQGRIWTAISESRKVTLTLLALVDLCDLSKISDTEILVLLAMVWPSIPAPRLRRGFEKHLLKQVAAN